VLSWSREKLMDRYDELLLKGVDPEGAAQALDPVAVEECERWQHEQKMKEMEVLERMKLQAVNAARQVELPLCQFLLFNSKMTQDFSSNEILAIWAGCCIRGD